MPVKSYDTRADFDADYFASGSAENTPLPPGTQVGFSGNTVTFAPAWPRPLVGGKLIVTVGRGHANNRSGVQVTGVSGDTVTVDGSPFDDLTVPDPKIRYHVPPIPMRYHSPAIRPGARRLTRKLLADHVPPGSSVVFVGSGFWDHEAAVDDGWDCVGVDTSAWIQTEKDASEELALRDVLLDANLDPDVGEGARLLSEWLTEPRTKHPILNEDVRNGGGRSRIARALNKRSVDWIIAIGLLPVLTNDEVSAVDSAAAKLAPNRLYYQAARGGAPFIWRSRAELEVLLGSGAVVVGAGV